MIEGWSQLLPTEECGGYYSSNPCYAQSCNTKHQLCEGHQKLLQLHEEQNGKKSS